MIAADAIANHRLVITRAGLPDNAAARCSVCHGEGFAKALLYRKMRTRDNRQRRYRWPEA
jgi:hypothetical protein